MKKEWKLVLISALAGLPFILIGALVITLAVINVGTLSDNRRKVVKVLDLHNGWENRDAPLDFNEEELLRILYSETRGVFIKTYTLGANNRSMLDADAAIPFRAELTDGRVVSGVFDDPWRGFLKMHSTQGEITKEILAEFDSLAVKAIFDEAIRQKANRPELQWLMVATRESDYERSSLLSNLRMKISNLNLKLMDFQHLPKKPTIFIYSSWMIGKKGIRVEVVPVLKGVKEPSEKQE